MNIFRPVHKLLFHNMLISATSRGQLPTQGIPSEYLTVFSSLSLKKRKNLEKNTPAEFRTLSQTSLASFLSPASGTGRCRACVLFPVDMSDTICCLPLTSITWDVWVASDQALSAISELGHRY